MKRAHALLIALAVAVTVSVTACGSSSKSHASTTTGGGSAAQSGTTDTVSSTASGSGAYPATFVNAFVKGCDTNGGTKAYCTCVISYIEKNVAYETVVSSQAEISDGKKPAWYTKAISGCLSKA